MRCLCHQYMKREWCRHVCARMLKQDIITLPRQFDGHHFGDQARQGRPMLYATGPKRKFRMTEHGGACLGERSPPRDQTQRAHSMHSSVKHKKTQKKHKQVPKAFSMDSPEQTPKKRDAGSMASPGTPTSQRHQIKPSYKRARSGHQSSPVVHTLGKKNRFELDSAADEAVEEERDRLESMSLTQIKAECFGKCYVAQSPMLMQKMMHASRKDLSHETSLNGLMAAKELRQGTVRCSTVTRSGEGDQGRQHSTYLQGAVSKVRMPPGTCSKNSSASKTIAFCSCEEESADRIGVGGCHSERSGYRARVECCDCNSTCSLERVFKTPPMHSVATSRPVEKGHELLVDYGEDCDQKWEHRL